MESNSLIYKGVWVLLTIALAGIQFVSCQRPGLCPSLALSYPACLMGMQRFCGTDNDCSSGYKCCACGTRSTCQRQASSQSQAICPLAHIDTGMPCNFNYECMEQLGECCYNNDHCVRPSGTNRPTCPENHRDTGTRCTTDNQCNVLRGECCYQSHHCVLPIVETSLFCPHDHRDTGRSCTYDQDCNMFDNECCYQRHHCVVPRRVQTCPLEHRDTGRVCRTNADCYLNRGECCYNSEHCVIPIPQVAMLRERFNARFPNGFPSVPSGPIGPTSNSGWNNFGQTGPLNPSMGSWANQFMGQGLMGPMRPSGGAFWGPLPWSMNMNNNRWWNWGSPNSRFWGPNMAGMTGQFPTTMNGMTGQFPTTMNGITGMTGQFPTTMSGMTGMTGQFPTSMNGIGPGFNPSINTAVSGLLPGLGGGPLTGQFGSPSVPISLISGLNSGFNPPVSLTGSIQSNVPNMGPIPPVSPLNSLIQEVSPNTGASSASGNIVNTIASMAANLLGGP